MPNHAGYAAAVTIRQQVFDDALLNAWHAGQIAHSFFKSAQHTPSPSVTANFFIGPPHVRFVSYDRVDGILRLNGWGTISVRTNPFPFPVETRTIQWQADLLITPTAALCRHHRLTLHEEGPVSGNRVAVRCAQRHAVLSCGRYFSSRRRFQERSANMAA